MSIYDYTIKNNLDEDISMKKYDGKVFLIVNTATKCGFTPQYNDLESLYKKYKSYGFEIIDIPCNQFANQAPESDEEITNFCTTRFGTTFPQMKKSIVNGEDELPLYTFLKSQKGFKGFGSGSKALALTMFLKTQFKDFKTSDDIKWNFTKFLIDRQGNVIERFEPTINFEIIDDAISKLI